jgi:hypothetical protein
MVLADEAFISCMGFVWASMWSYLLVVSAGIAMLSGLHGVVAGERRLGERKDKALKRHPTL